MAKKEKEMNVVETTEAVETTETVENVGEIVGETPAEEKKDEITVEQVKEISDRIAELNATKKQLDSKKAEFDIHMKDLETIKTIYGESSKQFENKKTVIQVADSELKELEDKIEKLSFTRAELKPYLDAAIDIFDKERMSQSAREYHVNVTDYKTFNLLLDYCYHSMMWTAKTAPALMTLAANLEENKRFARSKDFDGVIILRAGNILALQDFMTTKMEGKGWNTAKVFLACWASCGKSITEAAREVQKDYKAAREYAKYLNDIDTEYGMCDDGDSDDGPMTTGEEVGDDL